MTDDKTKNQIDRLFDIADSVVGKAAEVIKQPASPSPSSAIERWEQGFEETTWSAATNSCWHAFRMGSMKAVCGVQFTSSQLAGREVLEYGKSVVACTSCIIGVSK